MERKKNILLFFFVLFIFSSANPQVYDSYKNLKNKYIQLSGDLFKDVQLYEIFKDSKTFVDAVPKKNPDEISRLYDSLKVKPDFDLSQFVYAYFEIPGEKPDTIKFPERQSMDQHIETLWKYLIRQPDKDNLYSTLIPLEHPYMVPGGRFREIYYWDSFFTILGLLADNQLVAAENMVYNFAYLIENYSIIPNGNRIYYLTRSQPPFFALMVDIICRYKKDFSWGLQFLGPLEAEYLFWMNGLNKKNNDEKASERVVLLNSEGVLNRYFDFDNIPREESYREDYNSSLKIDDSLRADYFRNIRAAAESGWDFSSRWFGDSKSLLTINTTDILPIDLNCLLYFLENRLSFFYELKGDLEKTELYKTKASLRLDLINNTFWNEEKKFYFDYNWQTRTHTNVYSLAGYFPLYFGIARPEFADTLAQQLKDIFLMPGGLITTLNQTGQQWDAPNGWAPLQWIAIKGLREYGIDSLAEEIKERWLRLNENVFKRTGKMFEKYNVENLELFAGGGEYPTQDGFGWTNGVAAALISNFDEIYLFVNLRR